MIRYYMWSTMTASHVDQDGYASDAGLRAAVGFDKKRRGGYLPER